MSNSVYDIQRYTSRERLLIANVAYDLDYKDGFMTLYDYQKRAIDKLIKEGKLNGIKRL